MPEGWYVIRVELLGDERQQLFGQHGCHIHAAIGSAFTAQEPDDRVSPVVGRLLPHPQSVEHRQQWLRLS